MSMTVTLKFPLKNVWLGIGVFFFIFPFFSLLSQDRFLGDSHQSCMKLFKPRYVSDHHFLVVSFIASPPMSHQYRVSYNLFRLSISVRGRVCPLSVGRHVRPFVDPSVVTSDHPSVGPSVCLSVCPSHGSVLFSTKTAVFEGGETSNYRTTALIVLSGQSWDPYGVVP